MKKIYFFSLLTCMSIVVQAQLSVTIPTSPSAEVENIFLANGIFVNNITYTGVNDQFGIFNGTGSYLGIGEGIVLSSGNATAAADGVAMINTNTNVSDDDLLALTSLPIYDVCAIEFDFIATGDSMNFQFVFASQEYPEWVGSGFNDVFGFFVSGPGIMGAFANSAVNIATVPGTGDYISINNINADMNSQYYVDNSSFMGNFCDAYTVPMNASIGQLSVGEVYHIKIAISDVSDMALDSWVFLGGDSFDQFCSVGLLNEDQSRGSGSCMLSELHASVSYTQECGTINFINNSSMNMPYDNSYFDMGNGEMIPAANGLNSYEYTEEGNYEVKLIYTVGDFHTTYNVGNIAVSFTPPVTPTIDYLNNVLVVTNYDGTSQIQWLLGGAPIEGATGTSYIPTIMGNYSVQFINGCASNSETVFLELMDVNTLSATQLAIYPNPTEGMVRIEWMGEKGQLMITNALGQVVMMDSLTTNTYDLSNLPSGMYVVRVVSASGAEIANKKLVIK